MKVRATGRARREIVRADEWWRAERPEAPTLFLDELAALVRLLEVAPETGQRYGYRGDHLIRRRLLERCAVHVYFTIDHAAEVVTVHAVWGARRGRGPRL